jgi:hypothetical protein
VTDEESERRARQSEMVKAGKPDRIAQLTEDLKTEVGRVS